MNIKTIASSSSGCCYIIESGEEKLMIEIGVPLSLIRKHEHHLSKIAGCLISHVHGDHSGFVKNLENLTSVKVWCTSETAIEYDLYRWNKLEHKKSFNVGPEFKVRPLKMYHDCEIYGFLIKTKDDSLLYATDTSEVPYTIPDLKKVMIEANHSLDDLVASSEHVHSTRAAQNHLDIDKTIDFIKRHPSLNQINLIHVSLTHADIDLFRKRAIDASGVPVNIYNAVE